MARATSNLELRPHQIAGKIVVVPESKNLGTRQNPFYAGVSYQSPANRTPTSVLVLRAGKCAEDPDLARGLPILGNVNLNHEQDRLFGNEPIPTRRVEINNPNPGRRYVVQMGSTPDFDWAVLGRASVPFPRQTASDLYRWSGKKWTHAGGSGARGVDWPYAAGWRNQVLVAERDQRAPRSSPAGDGIEWRLRVVGSKAPALVFARREDSNGCGGRRVTGLYAFDNGEILTTGATCRNQLLLERWASADTAAVSQVVAEMSTDEVGFGYEIDVLGPSLLRLRTPGSSTLELKFDGQWRVAPTATALRQDALLEPLTNFATTIKVERGLVVGDQVFVSGELQQAPRSVSVLLTDQPVTTPCVVADAAR